MDYSELADLFPSLYTQAPSSTSESFSTLQGSSSKRQIPKILHYIWLGDKPLSEDFRQNISFFSNLMRELGGMTLLWTDQSNINLKANVQLMNVNAVFANKKNMATFNHFKAALAKIPPNFGEASDLLRYEILDFFGGYYLDCDVKQGYVDLNLLLSKGSSALHGFVCGLGEERKYYRNDILGSVPKGDLLKIIKSLVCENYKKKKWKNSLKYARLFLIEFTVVTTGPDVLGEAIKLLINKGNKLDSKQIKELAQSALIPSIIGSSTSSWANFHIEPKQIVFSNDQERLNRIKHDLMLNLIYEEKILDLDKYQHYLKAGDLEWLISQVEDLVNNHPQLVEAVDRIFIGDVKSYCHLKKMLEESLKKEIVWNELAVLKFACVMGKNALIQFLIDKGISPFDYSFADVGYYDCSNAQPFAILLERGNLEMVSKILATSNEEKVKISFAPRNLGLVYVGDSQMTANKSTFYIPKLKIKQLESQFLGTFWQEVTNRYIERLQAIQKLLDQFLYIRK